VRNHLIETAVVAAAAVVVAWVLGWAITRRAADEYARRSVRRAIHFMVLVVALVVLGYVWGIFSQKTSWAFALLAAGFAFALQEVLGVFATRLVKQGLADCGIDVASTSLDVAVTSDGGRTTRESSRSG
jgi:MFS family permease